MKATSTQVSKKLSNLADRISRAGDTDATRLNRDERKRRIRELLVKHLATSTPEERQRLIDEAVLLRVEGRERQEMNTVRAALHAKYGNDESRWSWEARSQLLDLHKRCHLARLEPEALDAIIADAEAQAGGGDTN